MSLPLTKPSPPGAIGVEGSHTPAEKFFAKFRALRLGRAWLFRLGVIFPTLVAIVYYGLIAAPQYVSVSQFIVRSVNNAQTSGFDAFFRTFGISRAVDDTNVVQNFILSRDAVAALDKKLNLRKIFENPKADIVARYPPPFFKDSNERLYRYYQSHVTVIQGTSQGIATLRVATFDAASAQKIAAALMGLAEGMVNQLNDRAQHDSVKASEETKALAEQNLLKAQAALTAFRNKEAMVDPDKNSVADLETSSTLALDLAQTLVQMRQNVEAAPAGPVNAVLSAKAKALQQAVDRQRAAIAGGNGALVDKMSEYDQLKLSRDIAQKSFEGSVASLETARQEARRKQIYLEEVVQPSLPDVADEPQRWRMILTVFASTFAVFAVLWLIAVGASEHAQ
ncbi:MAG: hypothetical protein KGQ46_04180 [Hyphomicrobiales bacterium]|nr:hypothetical protein [Hyphomicrobiales bacterium]MDE2115950.1 hypothetical protein [Hyphomicrobiales bacterium]